LESEELEKMMIWINEKFQKERNGDFNIPNNFIQNVDLFTGSLEKEVISHPDEINNPQTNEFLKFLELENKISQNVKKIEKEENPDEIELDL
jgi:hypothetical protein